MVSALISRLVILVCGTLYPAYASYKAIRTKNVREYVKWMMYWIVFALFSAIETFSDVFLSWLPFYYEIKMIFVIWMLSPITKGSSYLYKKFVHPQLAKREKEIDEYISQATNKGYSTLLHLGQRGLTFATNVVVRTAVRGQTTLVDQIRKSYSTNDLRVPIADESVAVDSDEEFDNRLSEDNRELERRKDKRRLHRSASDVTDSRVQRVQKSATGLSSLEEEEENVEEEQIYTEEIIYRPRMNYTPKENKMDPYGTLPRTRQRTRTRLQQF